jgi:hypothetical protein
MSEKVGHKHISQKWDKRGISQKWGKRGMNTYYTSKVEKMKGENL